MDFNLRRAIEMFALAKMLPADLEKKYPKFQDGELAPAAARVVEKMDPSVEDVPASLHRLKEIELGRTYRNLVGHFAAKRFPGEEVLVFASKDERDAERVLGGRLQRNGVLTALAPIKQFRELTRHMIGPSDWIAHRIPVWFARYDTP